MAHSSTATTEAATWHPLSPEISTAQLPHYFDAATSSKTAGVAVATASTSKQADTHLDAPASSARPSLRSEETARPGQRRPSVSKPLFEDEEGETTPSASFTWSLPRAPHLLTPNELEQRLLVLARETDIDVAPARKRKAVTSGRTAPSQPPPDEATVPLHLVSRLVAALSAETERIERVRRSDEASKEAQLAALRQIIYQDAMGVSEATIERALLRAEATAAEAKAMERGETRPARWQLQVADLREPEQPSPDQSLQPLPADPHNHLDLELQEAMSDSSFSREPSVHIEPASPASHPIPPPSRKDRHSSVSARLFAGLGAARPLSPSPSIESNTQDAPSPPATPVATVRARPRRSESTTSTKSAASDAALSRSAAPGITDWAGSLLSWKKKDQAAAWRTASGASTSTEVAAEDTSEVANETDHAEVPPRLSSESDNLATPVASRHFVRPSTDSPEPSSSKSPSSSISASFDGASVSSRPTTAPTTGDVASPTSPVERPPSTHSADQTKPLHSAVSAVLSKRQLHSPAVIATHASPISHPASVISSPMIGTFSVGSATGSLPLPHPSHYRAVAVAGQKYASSGAKGELPASLLQHPRKVSPTVKTWTTQLLASLHERRDLQSETSSLRAPSEVSADEDDDEAPSSPSPPPTVKPKTPGYLKSAKGTLGRALGLTPGPASRPRNSSGKRVEPSLTLPGVVVNRPGQVFSSLVAASSTSQSAPSGPISMELDTIVKPDAKPAKFGDIDAEELVTDRYGFVIEVGSGMRTLRELRQRNRTRLPVPETEPVVDAVRSAIGPSPTATPSLSSTQMLEPEVPPATAKATSAKLLGSQLAEMNDVHERALRTAWDELIQRRRTSKTAVPPPSTSSTSTAKNSNTLASTLDHETCEDIGFTEALIGIAAIGREGKGGHDDFQAFRTLMKAGVPVAYRPAIWMEVAGVREKKEVGLYEELVARHADETSNACAKQIDADVGRTFGSNVFFGGDGPGVAKLRRVLNAFAWHVPEVGYCQGMNMLAGTLLLIYPSEEDAFWLLVVLITVILPGGYFSPTLETVIADQAVMADLLRVKLPEIHAHLEAKGVNIAAFTLSWFLSLFTVVFPIQTLLRVWDLILCDGALVLFRITLAMLSMHQQEILACDDDTPLMEYLRTLPTTLHQVDKLIRVATTDFKSVKTKDIYPLREKHLGRPPR